MPNRRPLATRDTKLANRAAAALARRGVSPNRISQLSILFAALAGGGFWVSGVGAGFASVAGLVAAAAGCQLRLLCNLLDGMVAVEGGQGVADGPFWNEVPDRVADAMILAGLGLGAGQPALGWAAAALAIGTAYLREFGCAQGVPADFRGPMAKPHRMALATGAALVATVAPNLAGVPTLTLALWLLIAGTALTLLRRSHSLLIQLRARG
ncbi:CDP-alcohol phosphatidyltransferase family protein [Palleronia caenipelagi]|uniref:CDP-alcohol phosphatidyltransferase family protein n=1 Tax=Palleronia caenipelagi TaxID=2489174 RepID=A0A547PUL9_9RHOB|nr:CDP-alcohol phosphatidyltransferase family protein [Palleronia caenipelagi]TRD17781.1 CDP-alcohol phosphatidyltransferase family protein [Palleronia caenipelagi]